ncbi:MAG: VWA domain-containing protein [Anaerolineae bacterium]|nr:VWA domain-containing protein [Anaerolineae bacterium]
MVKNYLQQMKAKYLDRLQPQKGQSIIIVTFAFLGLLAMLGLALDLGLVYIERVRVSRTADAAALAAVVELPFEEEAMRRAVEYIELNGYDVGVDTEVRVRGCIADPDDPSELANVDGPGKQVLGGGDAVQPHPDDLFEGYPYIVSAEDPPRAIFVIDTLAYQPFDTDSGGNIVTKNEDNCITDSLYGTANKIRVTGQVNVDMNFMQFFGFGKVPVSDRAVGENVTNLDVVVVFDVSGSMSFETTCFDCWEPYPSTDANYDVVENPWPSNGSFNPLPDTTTAGLCTQNLQYVTDSNGKKYSVHEAELYSRDVPHNGWEFEKRLSGQGFWVLQRFNNMDASGTDTRGAFIRSHPYSVYSQYQLNQYPQLQGGAYNNECFNGPNLSGNCWASTASLLGESPPSNNPPYVEYDFTPDWTGNTHVWIRAQGAYNYAWKWLGQNPKTREFWPRAIFWQLGPADGSNWSDVQGRDFTNLDQSQDYDFPQKDRWRWLKLGDIPTTQGAQYTLRLYQGSAGFNVDKIIFTNFSGGDSNTTIAENGSVKGDSTGINNTFKNLVNQNGGKGPVATNGSATREACNVCNPAFGQTVDLAQCSCKTSKNDNTASSYGAGGAGIGCTQVLTETNQLANDLYHDIDPLRSAKEAVKNFANRLDPKFDQIGLVAYSSNVKNGTTNGIKQRSELQCIKWATKNTAQGVRKCYDPTTSPISYTNLIRSVEIHNNNGGTNIADGMHEGLIELGIDTDPEVNLDHDCKSPVNDGSVCDRQGAARRIIVLMTDGSPNANNTGCPANNLWKGTFGQGNKAYDCAMYYAIQAANRNVTLYTIGIGSGVNIDLLTAMATGVDPTTEDVYFEQRGGAYYPAAKPSDLDQIFDIILSNVFVRIVN